MSLIAAAAISGAFMGPAFATTSGNLLVDGDGESGKCTADWSAVTTVPGWTVVQGSPALVCYSIGGFTTPSSPAPGTAFIADGPYGDSELAQTVNVSSAATAIDAGGVTFNLSGWLGGYTVYSGQAVVTATFFDANGNALGSPAQLSGVTASARGDKTEFLAKSTSGAVPAKTRFIDVTVAFVNTSGSYNVGYADNLSLTLSTPVTAPTLSAPTSSVPAFDHVFVVMMENTDYSQVIGDTSDAPFINSLAAQGTLLTNYSGAYHPSDENYLAIAGGGTFVQGAIYWPNIHVASQHIGDELVANGKTWKAYEQGMGTPCNTTTQYDSKYEPDDAPFINFTDVQSNTPLCQSHLFDTTQLTTDLQSAATTPNFSWIAADDYYDGEASGDGSSASLKVQDGWLKQTLQPIFNSPAWKTQRSLLILTWDESSGSTATNHVATFVIGSQGLVGSGVQSGTSYNHFSTGTTIEHALGIAPLTPNDKYAQPINDAFGGSSPPPPPPTSTLTTSTPSVTQGTNIIFNYATTPAMLNSDNWVGIYPTGNTPGQESSTEWQYTSSETGTASFSTSSLSAGTYNAWYLYNNGYTTLAGPTSFTVTP
ncbi:MAG TPA: alkaline phosphatase family protein [Xanthomonadaceae bacterium]|nr:alkaline phosphatase family protein [Xanthomonadaceae bacterium]